MILVGSGAALAVHGWTRLAEVQYLAGLILLGVGVLTSVAALAPQRGRVLTLVGAVVVTVALTVGIGIVLPRHNLASEFAGRQVRWSRGLPGDTDAVGITVVHDDRAVVTYDNRGRVIDLASGSVVSELAVDDDERVARTEDGFVVGRPGHTIALYDAGGHRLSESGPHAFVVARADGITAYLDDCGQDGCMVRAVDDEGNVEWERSGYSRPHLVLHTINALPDPPLSAGAPVIPRTVLLPRSRQDRTAFDQIDLASGRVVRTVHADRAAVQGDRVVGIRRLDDRCRVSAWEGADRPSRSAWFPCDGSYGVIVGSHLVMTDARGATVLDLAALGEPDHITRGAEGLAYGPEGYVIAGIEGSPFGLRLAPRVILGSAWGGGRDDRWAFRADGRVRVAVGAGSVAVWSPAARRNAFDHSNGPHSDVDLDWRVTVLDLGTGRVTGSLRLHDRPAAVRALGDGSALVAGDHRLILLGNPVHGG